MRKETGNWVGVASIATVKAVFIFIVFRLLHRIGLAETGADKYRLVLDHGAVGESPPGWQASATNPDGPIAQWAVGVDSVTPRQKKMPSIERILDTSSAGQFQVPSVIFRS